MTIIIVTSNFLAYSYMILAPALMSAEPDPKKAAQHCFDSCGLDPDMYRIGHTKASWNTPKKWIQWLTFSQFVRFIFVP